VHVGKKDFVPKENAKAKVSFQYFEAWQLIVWRMDIFGIPH